MRGSDIGVEIPAGYQGFSLVDVDESLERADLALAGLVPADALALVMDLLRGSLGSLGESGAIYCGVGRHLSAVDGEPVASWLTVSVHDGAGQDNPRLALAEFVVAAGMPAEAVAVVDLEGQETAFYERVCAEGAVYQLRVLVPAADGARITVLEVPTAQVEQGPRYRLMMIDMARSARRGPRAVLDL